jgi:hypothetical protein
MYQVQHQYRCHNKLALHHLNKQPLSLQHLLLLTALVVVVVVMAFLSMYRV